MGAAGAIAAMVIAGLIIYGLIFYGPSIWHEIQEATKEGLTVAEVLDYRDKYWDKEITVRGLSGTPSPNDPTNPQNIGYIIQQNEKTGIPWMLKTRNHPSTLRYLGEYRFTGVLRNENGTPVLYISHTEPV